MRSEATNRRSRMGAQIPVTTPLVFTPTVKRCKPSRQRRFSIVINHSPDMGSPGCHSQKTSIPSPLAANCCIAFSTDKRVDAAFPPFWDTSNCPQPVADPDKGARGVRPSPHLAVFLSLEPVCCTCVV